MPRYTEIFCMFTDIDMRSDATFRGSFNGVDDMTGLFPATS